MPLQVLTRLRRGGENEQHPSFLAEAREGFHLSMQPLSSRARAAPARVRWRSAARIRGGWSGHVVRRSVVSNVVAPRVEARPRVGRFDSSR